MADSNGIMTRLIKVRIVLKSLGQSFFHGMSKKSAQVSFSQSNVAAMLVKLYRYCPDGPYRQLLKKGKHLINLSYQFFKKPKVVFQGLLISTVWLTPILSFFPTMCSQVSYNSIQACRTELTNII